MTCENGRNLLRASLLSRRAGALQDANVERVQGQEPNGETTRDCCNNNAYNTNGQINKKHEGTWLVEELERWHERHKGCIALEVYLMMRVRGDKAHESLVHKLVQTAGW